MKKTILAAVASAAAAAALAPGVPAQARSDYRGPQVRVLSSAFAAPFNIKVTGRGILVADGMQNAVLRLRRNGSVSPVVKKATGAAGIAARRWGHVWAYTTTTTNFKTFKNTASALTITNGRDWTVKAHTLAFEKKRNPDERNHYGIRNPTSCQRKALEQGPGAPPASYHGLLDSHSYSVAPYGKRWVVADAGGNDLLLVNNRGGIRAIAVLPPQRLRITKDIAATQHLPKCLVGATYSFEPVPTDVEIGRDGFLYVTTLPGGPEDPSLGGRGSVYKVDPHNGRTRRIAHGLLGATNLAIGHGGRIYVTELFGGRVSVVRNGHVQPYVKLPGALSIESGRQGTLFAGTIGADDGSAPGTVVRISAARN